MSHLIDGVASLSDDDNNQITNVPTRGVNNQEKVKTTFLKTSYTTSETLIFNREDEEEKKHLSGQDKDIEASTNADSSENFGKKTKASANQKRNKKEKKKERKGTFQFEEEEKQFESNNGTQTTIGDKSEYIFKAEKPALIKTLTLDQDEYEIALEAFLNNEYQGDAAIPAASNPHLNSNCHTENTEYKLKLVNPSPERIEHLTNQMKLRLQEGHGEAKYEIGLGSDGTAIGLNRDEMFNSLKTLCTLASNLKADVIILRMRDGQQGKTAEVLVRSNQKDGIKLDMKIMLLGDQQCGKSTLIGVLTSGKLDDGRGSARKYVHVHKHDVVSGETSSLSHHILGFDSQGNVTNHTETGHASWGQIVDTSTKILTFLDIGGHEKYTTKIVSGLCSFYPDYTLIVVSAVQGVTNMAEKHLKLACVFGVPFIIAVTHADLATQKDLFDLRSNIERTLRKYCEGKYLIVASNDEDNVILSRTLKENIGIPVFMLSCVKGTNMDLFKSFLNLLPVNNTLSTNINLHSEFYIHTTFNKENKLILGGTVIKGCIKKHQVLFLGPDEKGKFRHIEVASIQCKKVSVQRAYCGQSCTIEIKMGKFAQQWLDSSRDAIRRGMVLVDLKSNPKAAIEFTAEISLFEEKSTKAILWEGYEPVIISQTTHQVCTIDFDQIKPEEIKEEDLQKLKDFTDSLSYRQPPKRNVHKDEFGLPILKLGKQKSKSQDFRDIQIKKTVEGEPFGKSPERKQSSFSRRKIANVILTTNDMALKASSFKSDSGEEKTIKKKNFKQPSEQAPAHLKQLFDEVDQNNNMSVKEKIKNVKKTIYMYAEDFAPKRKQKIKFITIKPGETKVLRFRFKYHSEYITKGQKIIINDSSMKSVGTIRDVVYIDPKT